MILRITLATFSIVAWVSSLEVPHIGSLSLSTLLECPHPPVSNPGEGVWFCRGNPGKWEIPELTLGLWNLGSKSQTAWVRNQPAVPQAPTQQQTFDCSSCLAPSRSASLRLGLDGLDNGVCLYLVLLLFSFALSPSLSPILFISISFFSFFSATIWCLSSLLSSLYSPCLIFPISLSDPHAKALKNHFY